MKTIVRCRSSRLYFGARARSRCIAAARQLGAAEMMTSDGRVVRFFRDEDQIRQKTWPADRVQVIHDIRENGTVNR